MIEDANLIYVEEALFIDIRIFLILLDSLLSPRAEMRGFEKRGRFRIRTDIQTGEVNKTAKG